MSALLETRALTAFYGDFQALYGIDFEIAPGEVVAIIGANGAGRSCGRPGREPDVCGIAGAFEFDRAAQAVDHAVLQSMCDVIARRGLALVPEGRRLFPSLDVEENLKIGADRGAPGPWTLAAVYDLFPMLRERRKRPATALSGGSHRDGTAPTPCQGGCGMAQSQALLYYQFNPPAGNEAAFLEYYDEHQARRMEMPGFINARRYHLADLDPDDFAVIGKTAKIMEPRRRPSAPRKES